MAYEVLLTDFAANDVKETYDWYEEQLLGLGEDFYENLLAALDQLSFYPNTGSDIEFGIQKVLVKTYPYAVYYSVKDNKVRVLRVLHQRRHPDTWKKT